MAQLYKVDNVYKTVDIDRKGNFVEVYEVTFTTVHDITSKVKIPANVFSKEEVQKVIEQEVNNINDVMNL